MLIGLLAIVSIFPTSKNDTLIFFGNLLPVFRPYQDTGPDIGEVFQVGFGRLDYHCGEYIDRVLLKLGDVFADSIQEPGGILVVALLNNPRLEGYLLT